MIEIKTVGSFGNRVFRVSAQDYGHAQAVADAITFLSSDLLQWSIREDHALHSEGASPTKGFGSGPGKVATEKPPWLDELLEALGWQGGTIHQALSSIRKLRSELDEARRELERYQANE